MRWKVWALSLAAAALAGAARAETKSFGDWTVVCDNVRNCSAFGFSPEAAEDTAYLKLERGSAASATPALAVALYTPPAGNWRLAVDGRDLGEVTPVTEEADDQYPRATLPAETAQATIGAIRDGRVLTVAAGAKSVQISLTGSSAALRWMDAQQKRAGTTSALVARGKGRAPAAPAAPLVRTATVASQAGLPKTLPPSVQHKFADCDADMPQFGQEPLIARLSPGVVLWAAPCSHGAYNVIYALYLGDEAGRNLRPARFPYESGQAAVRDLMNVDFDPKTQTLSNFDKARGLGDCGAFSEWVWDGKAFRLKAQSLMPECRAVPWDDWPTSYVTRSR